MKTTSIVLLLAAMMMTNGCARLEEAMNPSYLDAITPEIENSIQPGANRVVIHSTLPSDDHFTIFVRHLRNTGFRLNSVQEDLLTLDTDSFKLYGTTPVRFNAWAEETDSGSKIVVLADVSRRNTDGDIKWHPIEYTAPGPRRTYKTVVAYLLELESASQFEYLKM